MWRTSVLPRVHILLTAFNDNTSLFGGTVPDSYTKMTIQTKINEKQYLEMIRLKTAVLLGCALKMGAIIGGASVKDMDAIYDFGIHLGVAFQLQDDYLDAFGDQSIFGKKIGGDILENKKIGTIIKSRKNESVAILKTDILPKIQKENTSVNINNEKATITVHIPDILKDYAI
mgnify:CR=1 FL=1